LKKFGEITVVQAKRYNNKVTNKAIQEVVESIKYYNAHKGAVITNNEFTDSAIELTIQTISN
jgi:restriction system protein